MLIPFYYMKKITPYEKNWGNPMMTLFTSILTKLTIHSYAHINQGPSVKELCRCD